MEKLLIGKIIKPQGLSGEVKCQMFVDFDAITNLSEVYLKDKLGALGYAWKDNAEGIPVVADEKNAMYPITKIYKKLMEIEEEDDGEGSVLNLYSVFLMLLSLHYDE